MKLRTALTTMFADWRDDVPSSWRTPLKHAQTDADGVPASASIGPSIGLFPRPKDDPSPKAAPGSCVLRSIERVKFKNVRVVVMGQDPYPRIRQATGRAFEPGDWTAWNNDVPRSFMRVAQRLAEFRTGDSAFCSGDGAWKKVRDCVADGTLDLDSPRKLYDQWEDQGVIFLNAVLTYTLPKHVMACHGVFWKPVVSAIMTKLAARPTGRVVFALWGGECEKLFKSAGVKAAAQNAGAWESRVSMVKHLHPSAHAGAGGKPGFLTKKNPLEAINDELRELGVAAADLIEW